jgi:hypothetical protein
MQTMMSDPILKLAGTLLLTYTSHYGAAKIYSSLCVPNGIWGYIQGMFTTGSPICAATLSYVSNSQSSYATIITMTISRAVMDAILPPAAAA